MWDIIEAIQWKRIHILLDTMECLQQTDRDDVLIKPDSKLLFLEACDRSDVETAISIINTGLR